MPVRIYDISKKLGLENKEIIAKARSLGIAAAKVPSSSLDKISAEYLEEQLCIDHPSSPPNSPRHRRPRQKPPPADPLSSLKRRRRNRQNRRSKKNHRRSLRHPNRHRHRPNRLDRRLAKKSGSFNCRHARRRALATRQVRSNFRRRVKARRKKRNPDKLTVQPPVIKRQPVPRSVRHFWRTSHGSLFHRPGHRPGDRRRRRLSVQPVRHVVRRCAQQQSRRHGHAQLRRRPLPAAKDETTPKPQGCGPAVRSHPDRGHICNVDNKQEVSSKLEGELLFVGEEIPVAAQLVAGIAPFLPDPCNVTKIRFQDVELVKDLNKATASGATSIATTCASIAGSSRDRQWTWIKWWPCSTPPRRMTETKLKIAKRAAGRGGSTGRWLRQRGKPRRTQPFVRPAPGVALGVRLGRRQGDLAVRAKEEGRIEVPGDQLGQGRTGDRPSSC